MWIRRVAHKNESSHAYKWVVPQICKRRVNMCGVSHVRHTNELCICVVWVVFVTWLICVAWLDLFLCATRRGTYERDMSICGVWVTSRVWMCHVTANCKYGWHIKSTHCNTLQHTATHCNTLQHTETHCKTLRHTATHCNTLHQTAPDCTRLDHTATLQHTATQSNTLHHTATHCTTLQHTATHCNTLQHTATHPFDTSSRKRRRTPTYDTNLCVVSSQVVVKWHDAIATRLRRGKGHQLTSQRCYGVASVSRIDKIIGLFCKRAP